jgi:hypothetical protein
MRSYISKAHSHSSLELFLHTSVTKEVTYV